MPCFPRQVSITDRMEMFNKRGIVLKFCQGITSGLAHLHRKNCVLLDLAARCVQVTAAMSVKVSQSHL